MERQTHRKKDRQKDIIVYEIKIEIFDKNEQAVYPSEVIKQKQTKER